MDQQYQEFYGRYAAILNLVLRAPCCVPGNNLKLTDFSHPERSEEPALSLSKGSRSLQCHKNVSINYAPSALRFFASLRFAQNDNFCQIPVKQELTNANAFKSVNLSNNAERK